MADWPTVERFHKPVIGTVSVESLGANAATLNFGFASAAAVASSVVYIPFVLAGPYLVRKVWWYNGSAVSGNVDVGVYSGDGGGASGNAAKLFSSGTTAQSGASATQSVSLTTPYLLAPGPYYFAMAMSSTGQVLTSNGSTANAISFGALCQLSTFPLPATSAFASTLFYHIPLMGISSGTVI